MLILILFPDSRSWMPTKLLSDLKIGGKSNDELKEANTNENPENVKKVDNVLFTALSMLDNTIFYREPHESYEKGQTGIIKLSLMYLVGETL